MDPGKEILDLDRYLYLKVIPELPTYNHNNCDSRLMRKTIRVLVYAPGSSKALSKMEMRGNGHGI